MVYISKYGPSYLKMIAVHGIPAPGMLSDPTSSNEPFMEC